jgi:nitrogen fixation NifU-like protein
MPTYSPLVLEHFRRPRHRGVLESPTMTAEIANPLCGDRVRVQLRVEGDRVTAARFTAEACAVAVASASLLLERVEGATLPEVAAIDDASVVAWLESELPEGRRRCATLALEAVRRAITAPGAGVAS